MDKLVVYKKLDEKIKLCNEKKILTAVGGMFFGITVEWIGTAFLPDYAQYSKPGTLAGTVTTIFLLKTVVFSKNTDYINFLRTIQIELEDNKNRFENVAEEDFEQILQHFYEKTSPPKVRKKTRNK